MSAVVSVSGEILARESVSSTNPPLPATPSYRDFATRTARLNHLSGKSLDNNAIKEFYFPPCTATTWYGKCVQKIGIFFKGTFLQVQDAHLRADGTRPVAWARASFNILGKMVLGLSLGASVLLTLGLGLAGAIIVGGGGIFCGVKDAGPAGAYVGALIGCGIACLMTVAGGFLGSALISLTEPDQSLSTRGGTVLWGTLVPAYMSLCVGSVVIGGAQSFSEFKYLQAGDMRGFLFLHCFGIPT